MATVDRQPWYASMTRYHWLVLFVAWLGWVFDIMDTALFNFAKEPMLKELLAATPTIKPATVEGDLQLILLIGWSVGGLIFGLLADRWGRTRTMVVTILIYCLFTGLTAFCKTWEQVAAVRFFTGLGIGGEWAAGAALIAEVLPNRARAAGAAFLQSAAAFGPWFAAIANYLVPASSWRVLFFIGIAPALITVFIRYGIKEPERWQQNEARAKGSFFEPLRKMLAHPQWRKHAIIGIVLGLVGIAAAQNMSYWLPNIVTEVSKGLSADDIKNRKSTATLILHLGTLLGVFVVPWLCEKIGRKQTLLAFFIASPLSVVALAYGGGTWERLLILAPLMSFFTIGMSAAFVLYFPELFPTSMRATGAGFAYNVSRVLAAVVVAWTGRLIAVSSTTAEASPVLKNVAVTAAALAFGIIALAFAPETRGQPLPEDA